MHEASIALNVIEIAEEHCRNAGYRSISEIRLRIGSGSGIMPDSLIMAFNIVKLETLAENARLSIEAIPLGGFCRSCSREFYTEDQFILECPHCGGRDIVIQKGRELDIVDIEVD